MSFLTQQTRAQLRQIAVDAYNAGAAIPAATDAGSSFGATFDGLSLMAMEVQRQIAYNVTIARLSTIAINTDGTPNPDVDSFCNPFDVQRGGAQYATGQVVLTAPSNVTEPLLVPVGGIVTTNAGLQFAIVPDATQSAFSLVQNGYIMGTGTSSVTVTVTCVAGGVIGNVQAGQIVNLYSGPGSIYVAGITGVNNPTAFTTGAANESDSAYIARFTLQMSTGRTGTRSALGAAILGSGTGLTYSIGDQINANGTAHAAYFTAVVGILGQTTATPGPILSAARTAIEGNPATGVPQVRGIGISYQVISPTISFVVPHATIYTLPGYASATVIANCVTAFNSLVEGIGLDPLGNVTTLAFGGVYAALYAVPGVLRVDGLTLNATANVDCVAPFATILAPGTPVFTAG